MATSLAEQLKKLATPQTSILQQKDRKRASLLFDAKEAATYERVIIHEIAHSGLRELIKLNKKFDTFADSLFSDASIQFERAVQSKETNDHLDKLIKSFLLTLSPYLQLKCAHQTLEWLINRYLVHEYNKDDFITLILPYHETNIFVRCLQLVDIKDPADRWHWLYPIQKANVICVKSVILNHCASENSFLKLICKDIVAKTVEHESNTQILTVEYSFWCITVVGALEQSNVTENQLTRILPSILKGLGSSEPDFVSSAMMITAMLLVKIKLVETLITKILDKIVNISMPSMNSKSCILILVVCQSQVGTLKVIPEEIVKVLSEKDWFVGQLRQLSIDGAYVSPLMEALLAGIVKCRQDGVVPNVENFGMELLKSIILDEKSAETLLRTLLESYDIQKVRSKKSNDSEIWFCNLLKEFHTQYPSVYESLIKLSNTGTNLTPRQKITLNMLLSSDVFSNAILSKSGFAIFDKLSHHDVNQRLDAINYLTKNYNKLSPKDQEFLQGYITELFKETDSRILESMIKFPINLMKSWLGDALFESLIKILEIVGPNDDLVKVLYSGDFDEVRLFLHLLPFMFPKNENEVELVWKVLDNGGFKEVKGVVNKKMKAEEIRMNVTKILFKERKVHDFERIFELVKKIVSRKNKIYLLFLKAVLPKICVIETSIQILEMIIDKKLKCGELIDAVIERTKFDVTFLDLSSEILIPKYVSLCLQLRDDFNICNDLKLKLIFLSGLYFGDLDLCLRSLGLTLKVLKELENFNWLNKYESNLVIPSLIIQLHHNSSDVRKLSIQCLECILKGIEGLKGGYTYLVSALLERKNELILDHEQIPLILYTILSQDSGVQKTLKNTSDKASSLNTFNSLVNLATSDKVPLYFIAGILKILSHINSKVLLEKITVLGCKLLKKPNSEILSNILLQFNLNTLDNLNEKSNIWIFIKNCLENYKIKIGDEYLIEELLSIFTKDVFSILNESVQGLMIKLVIDIGTESDVSDVRSAVFKFFKRIDLNSKFLVDIFIEMNTTHVGTTTKRRRPTNIPSIEILSTKSWKNGITALEFLQNKKKIINPHLIISPVFDMLKKCLDFEEQASLEYPKQLILSCLLNCCQKLSPENTKWTNFGLISQSSFNIELIVQCIRATQNPQTHHHALLLLSHLAGMFPEEVLQHIMAIFTFMGSSVLRHDDAYSFEIVTKIIEIVIPILVNSNQKIDFKDRIIPVLRVFVAALLDVPVHRRIPLYEKLLNKFDVKNTLWIFLTLVFESHILNSKDLDSTQKRLEIASTIALQFSPDVILHTCIELLKYLKQLPADKLEGYIDKVFSFDPTSKQYRHYKYTIITFIAGLLSSNKLIHTIALFNDETSQLIEPYYRNLIITILSYIQDVSKLSERNAGQPQGKYWRVMLHHCFDILDHINSLLTSDMFLLVIRGLMSHNISIVRRKAMELLNSKLQSQTELIDDNTRKLLLDILDSLIRVVSSISEIKENEDELNQQTALYSIKLLSKKLEEPEKFKSILDQLINLLKSKKINQNVLASVILTFAELISNLGINSLYSLNNFMPVVIKLFSLQKSKSQPDLLLLSIVTAIVKILDTLPLFMSPYLPKILSTTTILSSKFKEFNNKTEPVVQKLKLINQKLATAIPHRVLVPAIGETHQKLISTSQISAISYLMDILSESIKILQGADLKAVQAELTDFFIPALGFRSENQTFTLSEITEIEGNIIKAFTCLILKLSESCFRPLYYKLFDWSTKENDRSITFYRVSRDIASCLKGLFVLFAGHFLKNSAQLLDLCNTTKNPSYFKDSSKTISLITYILETLSSVFLYDTQNFVNKDRFEILLQPIVDQLENTIGTEEEFKQRVETVLVPCISNFAVAIADDSLWKQLNYQILLKTRNNSSCVRLAGLKSLCEMAKKLGEDFLPLLPETIPFIAELMEDEDEEVENACRKAVQELEKVLGESLQKYF